MGTIGITKQLQKVNANGHLKICLMWYVPSNTARDKHLIKSSRILKAYDYLMGLESDVKRQLSLLLSSLNKQIVWPEVSCHDGEL